MLGSSGFCVLIIFSRVFHFHVIPAEAGIEGFCPWLLTVS